MPRYKGGARARRYDVTSAELPHFKITPQLEFAEEYTTKQLRAEYTRMRDIAQKRIQRLGRLEPNSEAFKQHKEGFPKLKDIADRHELVYQLSELANFLTSARSSVSGIRKASKETRKAIKEKTGVALPHESLGQFGPFINAVKKALGLDPGKYELQFIADTWSDLKNKGKLTKKDVANAIMQVAEDLGKTERGYKTKARMAAQKIDKFFDPEDIDQRTRAAGKRKKRK